MGVVVSIKPNNFTNPEDFLSAVSYWVCVGVLEIILLNSPPKRYSNTWLPGRQASYLTTTLRYRSLYDNNRMATLQLHSGPFTIWQQQSGHLTTTAQIAFTVWHPSGYLTREYRCPCTGSGMWWHPFHAESEGDVLRQQDTDPEPNQNRRDRRRPWLPCRDQGQEASL